MLTGTDLSVVGFGQKSSWDSPDWVAEATKEEIHKDFTAWSPTIHNIIDMMETPNTWAQFDYHHTTPTQAYFKDNVCLIGDAAHAATSLQGSGAGMAIEDAYVLASTIGFCQSRSHLPAAFAAYDNIRRGRTHKLMASSREAGKLWQLELPGVMDDIAILSHEIGTRMHWIWNEDIEQEAQAALTRLADDLYQHYENTSHSSDVPQTMQDGEREVTGSS